MPTPRDVRRARRRRRDARHGRGVVAGRRLQGRRRGHEERARAGVRVRGRLREQLLRRRPVLQRRVHGVLQDVRRAGLDGHLHVHPRRLEAARPDDVPRPPTRRPAASTAPATARAPAAATSRARSAAGHVRRRGRRGRALVRRRRAAAGRGPRSSARRYSCDTTTGACFETCTQTSQCATRPAVRERQLRQEDEGREVHEATPTARRGSAPTACAATSRARAAASRARCRAASAPAGPSIRASPIRAAVCKDKGAPSCGTTGTCDGFGGCEKYARRDHVHRAVVHGHAAQHARHLRRARHLPAAGRAELQPVPVRRRRLQHRSASPTPTARPATPASKGLCGPKQNGQPCSAGAECSRPTASTASAATAPARAPAGAARSPSALGQVHVRSPAGDVDPRGVCPDQGAATCGDERQAATARAAARSTRWARSARPRRCAGNVYTPPSTCSATGQCVAARLAALRAVRLQRHVVLQRVHDRPATASTPNVCNGNSCGQKNNGASCSAGSECGSTFCAQGVCCDKACAGACTVVRAHGHARHVHERPDGHARSGRPLRRTRAPRAAARTASARRAPARSTRKGTPCKDSTCPAATTNFTPGSTCDGNGACVTPGGELVLPVPAAAPTVCKAACTADADCAAPAVCIERLVRPQGPRQDLRRRHRVPLEVLRAGRLLQLARATGTCQSCALSSVARHLQPASPTARSTRSGTLPEQGRRELRHRRRSATARAPAASTPRGTPCAAASCPAGASTLTQARDVRRRRQLQAARRRSRARRSCATATSALQRRVHRRRRLPRARHLRPEDQPVRQQAAPRPDLRERRRDCLTGDFCVDGVCCGTSTCGLCQTCNVVGKAGACANVGAGDARAARALRAASPPCGNTGNCNGARRLRAGRARASSCGTASCAGSTFTPVSHCTGAGACADADDVELLALRLRRGRVQDRLRDRRRLRRALHVPGPRARHELRAQGQRPRLHDGRPVHQRQLRRRRLLRLARAARACQACNLSGTGACAPVAGRHGRADDVLRRPGRRRPAARTASATARAAARSTPTARPARARPAPRARRRSTMAGACLGGSCNEPTHACAPYFCNGVAACPTTLQQRRRLRDAATTARAPGGTLRAEEGDAARPARTGDQCLTRLLRRRRLLRQRRRAARARRATSRGSAGTCVAHGRGHRRSERHLRRQPRRELRHERQVRRRRRLPEVPERHAVLAGDAARGRERRSRRPARATARAAASRARSRATAFKCDGAAACLTTCSGDGDCAQRLLLHAGGACAREARRRQSVRRRQPVRRLGPLRRRRLLRQRRAPAASCQACNVAGTRARARPSPRTPSIPSTPAPTSGAAACSTNGKCDGLGGLPEVRGRHLLRARLVSQRCRRRSRRPDLRQRLLRARRRRAAARTCATARRRAARPARATATARPATTARSCPSARARRSSTSAPPAARPTSARPAAAAPTGSAARAAPAARARPATPRAAARTATGTPARRPTSATSPRARARAGPARARRISCDDNNPCTADSCNPPTGCVARAADERHGVQRRQRLHADRHLPGRRLHGRQPRRVRRERPVPRRRDLRSRRRASARIPTRADGRRCNDGNACTQTDTCQAGVCTGANPVVCAASDQCHVAGTCNPTTGAARTPAKPDGTACTDGNACTDPDICVTGSCQPCRPSSTGPVHPTATPAPIPTRASPGAVSPARRVRADADVRSGHGHVLLSGGVSQSARARRARPRAAGRRGRRCARRAAWRRRGPRTGAR